MNGEYKVPELPLPFDLESKLVLKFAILANRYLGELKGLANKIPNEDILINSLTLQEARDSSEIENIITTDDELYTAALLSIADLEKLDSAAKEVLKYREALKSGFQSSRENGLLTLNDIKRIHKMLVSNDAGFRAVPGTVLKNNFGNVIYTPPQNKPDIERLMSNLVEYINDPAMHRIDPLIKLAIIHHQFESIHPFYDGNGRTGRIISILYLVINRLLDIPILYLSRFITIHKSEYYKLLQNIRDKAPDNQVAWEEWIIFILRGIIETAKDTIVLVNDISKLMAEFKAKLRPLMGKRYKHDLLNNLFFHPYSKLDFVERDLMVNRKTAAKYLEEILATGLLQKTKIGKSNYYVNLPLFNLFVSHYSFTPNRQVDIVQTITDYERFHKETEQK